MYCAQCGQEIPDGGGECPNCQAPAPAKKKHWTVARLVSLLVAGLLLLIIVVFVANFDSIEFGRKTECINNQKHIMLSLKMYARKYDDSLPDKEGKAGLEQLRRTIIKSTGIFICPSDKNKTKAEYDEPMTEENISYSYFGAGKKIGDEITDMPIICCEIHQTVVVWKIDIEQLEMNKEEFQKNLQRRLDRFKKSN